MFEKYVSAKNRWNRSLALKQLTYILLFSSIITLLGASIQLYMEYHTDVNQLKTQMEQIESVHLESLTRSLWAFDEEQIQIQINSIISMQDIMSMEIIDDNQVVFSAGQLDLSKTTWTREFEMVINHDGRNITIGTLRAIASMEGVYSRLRNRVLIILTTQGMRTFFVSMFILFIIYRMVTRHVIALVSYTKKMDLNKTGNNIELKKKALFGSGQDEIDQLASALNNMRQRLTDTLTRRRQVEDDLRANEEKYRSLFSSTNEGVCLHDMVYDQKGQAVDYRILEVNPAYEMVLGIKQEAAVGQIASQLYGTGRPPPYLDIFVKVVETGHPVSFETFFSNMQKHFKISVFSPGKGQFATLFADVTKQKKSEEQIKASLREKETLLNEIHHRVKNNMQVITSLLRLQSEKFEDSQYVDMLKESQSRIKAMALVHEKLYQTESITDIDFKGYVKSLAASLFRSYGSNPDKIALKIVAENVSLGLEIAIPCGLILNELISNSLKYAFPEEREGEISVKLYSLNETDLLLEVSDNGIGISKELDIRNTGSMGLYLVTILSEKQLEGNITLDRAGGTNYHIRFKKQIDKARI